MRKLYTTAKFKNLFHICDEEGDFVFGFDIMNSNSIVKRKRSDIIEIDPNCKLFTSLLRDNNFKVTLVELMDFTSVEGQAEYLGITSRTLYRMKADLNEKEGLITDKQREKI